MIKIIFFALIFSLFIVVAQDIPHTIEIITARGDAIFPISFFNSELASTYSASLQNGVAVRLDSNLVNVEKESFGSFNLIVGNEEVSKGIYFDTLIISKGSEIFQKIPVVVGLESKSSDIEYDVSIDFDTNSDISIISGETVLSPLVNVYKLNYNNPGSNAVALTFSAYSIEGDLIVSSEEVVSVSRQASFEHFFNLGSAQYEEVLIVVSARSKESFGIDLSQVSLQNGPLFSPPKNYSPTIYMGIFIFLISSIMLISYLWYNRSANQFKDWKSELEYVKKTQFSDAAKSLRKLRLQRDVLERAYSSKYISKASYDSAIKEIDKLSVRLKKRL